MENVPSVSIIRPPNTPICEVRFGRQADTFVVQIGSKELYLYYGNRLLTASYRFQERLWIVLYWLEDLSWKFSKIEVGEDWIFDTTRETIKDTELIRLFSAIYHTTFEILAKQEVF